MASIRERNGKFNVIYSYTNEKGERKQKWEGSLLNRGTKKEISEWVKSL